MIKINAQGLKAAKLGNSDNLKIGQWVMALGNPFGFAIENPESTVTVGVVSALHRYLPAVGRRDRAYDDLIQTDAAINPGNSGGALANLDGEVIGINTAIITTSGGYQGIGFAIPINRAKIVLNKLIKGEKIYYGWLGVSIQNLNDDLRKYFHLSQKKGVIVVKVYPDSPAQKAKLKEGDLILSYNRHTIKDTRELVRLVNTTSVGKSIPVKILRNKKIMTVKVKIGRRPEDIERMRQISSSGVSFRGLTVENITPLLAQKYGFSQSSGVVVINIEPDSLAERSGISVGDVIINVEGKEIKDKKDFAKITKKIKGSCLIKTNRGYFVIYAK